jgi:hypothetical protein
MTGPARHLRAAHRARMLILVVIQHRSARTRLVLIGWLPMYRELRVPRTRRLRQRLRRSDRVLPVDPRRLREPDHPAGNHHCRRRSHRLPDLDRGHLHGPVHPFTRGGAQAGRSTSRLGPHQHLQVRRPRATGRRDREDRQPELPPPARGRSLTAWPARWNSASPSNHPPQRRTPNNKPAFLTAPEPQQLASRSAPGASPVWVLTPCDPGQLTQAPVLV